MMWYVWYFSLSQDSFPQVLWYDFIIRCVLQEETKGTDGKRKAEKQYAEKLYPMISGHLDRNYGAAGLFKRGGMSWMPSQKGTGRRDTGAVCMALMRLMENILNMTKLESEEFEIRKNQEVVDDLIYEAVSHIAGTQEKRRFEIKLRRS